MSFSGWANVNGIRIGPRTIDNFNRLFGIVLIVCLLQPFSANAHDGSSGRVAELTHQLEHDPNNAKLLLQRGELFRRDEHFEEALKDLRSAAKHDSTLQEIDYHLGKTLFQMNRPDEARTHLDRYIEIHPNDMRALVTRARVLSTLGKGRKAAADFTRVIALSPLPDYYIERARTLAEAGHVDEAVRGLDEGHKKLGTLVSLQRVAIELDLTRKNVDGALARINSMSEITGRTDLWLARRGDVLLQAGRRDEALAAYRQSLSAMDKLSQRRKQSRIVRDLKNRLTKVLRQHAVIEKSKLATKQ